MDTQPTTERLFDRHRRAAVLIAVAVLGICAVSAVYLRPMALKKPTSAFVSAPAIDPLQVTADLVTFDFVTPSLGWAAVSLSAPSSTEGPFEVFQTVDGAKHWRLLLQGQSMFSGFVPMSVQMFGTGTGFMAVGGHDQQLYRTTDGGGDWGRVSLPEVSIEKIAFSDVNNGWLLGGVTSSAGQITSLYATSNAGNSWQKLPDPPDDTFSLSVRSPNEVWLGSFGIERPHVYMSSDAGHKWQRHDLPAPSGGQWSTTADPFQVSSELLPASEMVVSIVCSCASGPFHATSFDGGTTWRDVRLPNGIVAYQNAFDWWATNGKVLQKSHDAGRTWVQVTDRLPDQQFALEVFDSNHAWAALNLNGDFGLAFTKDGGLHWTRATVPQPSRKTS